MKIKNQAVFILIIVLAVLVGIWQFILPQKGGSNLPTWESKTAVSPTETSLTTVLTKAVSEIKVSIDFGDSQKIAGTVSAQTAYEALEKIAKEKDLLIEVKQYQFGVMVEKIGQKTNSDTYAWLYSINGKPGNTAADSYFLKAGDKVEWKYGKIIN